MKMLFRWFPNGDDSVTLPQIRQITGVSGVATCMPHIPVGEVWPYDEINGLKQKINANELTMEVIESVNIHEDIKKGLPGRDRYIDNYIETIKNLARAGVKCLCYNFMPVMDWVRSDLSHANADGSAVMIYRHEDVLEMNPVSIASRMASKAKGYSLPGWEPERLDAMAADIEYYQSISDDQYWENMRYFLDAVMPYAERYDVRMAIHPDDPPWPLYGLPKLIANAEGMRRFVELNKSPYNGFTLCTGSLGANGENDPAALMREFAGQDRVFFAHIRNVKRLAGQDFDECAHLSDCGDLDMFEIVRALYESGFDGYIRPDHGRMIWGEKARPGYGLYDRALGALYLLGLWEALAKREKAQ